MFANVSVLRARHLREAVVEDGYRGAASRRGAEVYKTMASYPYIQGVVRIVGRLRRELGAPRAAGHQSIVRQWRLVGLDGRTDVLTVYAPIKIRRPSDDAVANGRVTRFQFLGR